MKNMKKGIISVLLVLLLCISLLPAAASANSNFLFDADTGTIFEYTDYNATRIVIPAKINGVPVVAIGDYAFLYCSNLKSVTIPEGVTTVGYAAFAGCSGLTSITIPDSVTEIGSFAFWECSGLKSIKIPDGVTAINSRTFAGCRGITAISIPDNVADIDSSAFSGCTGITSFDVSTNNKKYSSQDGVLYSKDKKHLVRCPEGKKGAVTVPGSATWIDKQAFEGCVSIESITMLDGVTAIEDYAFTGCTSLKSITIPNSVLTFGNYAFYSCIALKSVPIPDSVTTLGQYAFCNCTSLESVNIPDSITDIAAGTFMNCTALKSVTVPGSVGTIFMYAFAGCTGLKSFTMIEGTYIQRIMEWVFEGCTSMENITLPDSVYFVSASAFNHCSSLKSIDVSPENRYFTSIDGVLYSKDMKTLQRCPDGKTGKVVIPSTVHTIESYAFFGFDDLAELYYSGTKEEWFKIRIFPHNDPLNKSTVVFLGDLFTDIAPDDYFFKPVLWAVDMGITKGTSATSFSPDEKCTRAHILTFLYRAYGEPEVTGENPFTDVKENAYYYKAALWAYQNGMVEAGELDADKYCERGEAVYYMWCAEGRPEGSNGSDKFTDVSETSEYNAAIGWAVDKGVTNGTSKTKFGTLGTTTRGQIVTFLYRYKS